MQPKRFNLMNGRVYQQAAWSGGLIRRLQEASHHLVRLVGRGRDAVEERIDERVGAETRVDQEEQIRQEEVNLVHRVFLAPGPGRRVMLFAGVERDNGCARLSIRAGRMLARLTPESVCVVDANFRSPALRGFAGADARDGFAAALSRPAVASTFAERLTPDSLWLLPAELESDAALLLTRDRVQPCLQELRARFNYLIINGPPMDLYADSLALGQFVDGVVLVLEANVTRRDTVRRVKMRLEDLNVPLLGVVLNNRTFPIPEAVYRLL